MLTRINGYTIETVRDSINYLLGKAIETPEVRMLAIEITQDKQDKVAAIYDWIKSNVGYVPDPINKELFISPVRMVNDYKAGRPLGGDCDDMALLATALYRSIGIQSNVVLIDQTGKGLDHAYCQAASKLGMTNVDPSANVPLGWAVKYSRKIVI